MGSRHSASCPCGYLNNVNIGGSRATFMTDSEFPFYCEKDGLVSVNFRNVPFACPWCKSSEIKQYGLPPVSLAPTNGKRWPDLQVSSLEAYFEGNLCPKCKEMTLVFSGVDMLFD